MSTENLEIYNKVAEVPQEAQKTIGAGRLKGMTDINPMWRIKALTETFGACGFGWKYIITDRRIIEGADGTQCAFVDIDLFVRVGGEWSEAIPGTGGSSFVANEGKGKHTNDEAFKMALTDALSVACKALGVGANVYWAAGRTKYSEPADEAVDAARKTPPKEKTLREKLIAKLREKGIDAAAYGKEHGLSHETTPERYAELLAELEG